MDVIIFPFRLFISSPLLACWNRLPLYYQMMLALLLGIGVGITCGWDAAVLALPGKLILRLLGTLAPPLILAALIHTLMTAEFGGRDSLKLAGLLMLNTLAAILIGLGVANIFQPGVGADLSVPAAHAETTQHSADPNPLITFLDNVSKQVALDGFAKAWR